MRKCKVRHVAMAHPASESSTGGSASGSGAPAGGAVAAVRAASRRGSLQTALAAAAAAKPALSGTEPNGTEQPSAPGGDPAGVAPPRHLASASASAPAPAAHGSRSTARSGPGGGNNANGPAPDVAERQEGGIRGGGGGGDGDRGAGGDVGGLPLAQQAVHYAREAAAAADSGDGVRSSMAVHLLNGCFLRAPSYEALLELSSAAASACPRLAGALVEAAAEGGPASLVALNALTYLALCPQAVPSLLSAGLVSVLLGQLRASASARLERQLLASGLGLLGSLVRVSGEARGWLAGTRGAAGALAGALGHEAAAVRGPALQLLQELMLTRKGLDQVTSCAPLLACLDRLCERRALPPSDVGVRGTSASDVGGRPPAPPSEHAGAEQAGGGQAPHGGRRVEEEPGGEAEAEAEAEARQARSLRRTIAALAAVMK